MTYPVIKGIADVSVWERSWEWIFGGWLTLFCRSSCLIPSRCACVWSWWLEDLRGSHTPTVTNDYTNTRRCEIRQAQWRTKSKSIWLTNHQTDTCISHSLISPLRPRMPRLIIFTRLSLNPHCFLLLLESFAAFHIQMFTDMWLCSGTGIQRARAQRGHLWL